MADDALVGHAFRCEFCGNSNNLKRCARCKRVFYCSREHQSKHWTIHKKKCKQPSSCESEKHSPETDHSAEQKTNENCNEPFVEFDGRPFKQIEFDAPSSLEFDELSKHMTDRLKSNGYCIIDGLFSEDLLDKVLFEFDQVNARGDMKPGQLAGGKTSGEEELKVTQENIRSDKIAWIEGTEDHIPATSEVVKTIDDIIGRFSQYFDDECILSGRTKAMMACYPGNGSCYRRHVDNPNKDGRVITCILYLNKDWDIEKDGGMLRILPENSDDHVDIAPNINRFLVFWSDRRNPHEVHPAFRTRYALTVWYFDGEERMKAKADRLNEDTLKIEDELSRLAVKTKQTERENIAAKIHNRSQMAVAGLSEEELDALATLVRGHPDPRGALSSLGIATSIQDVLLPVLSNRVT